MKKTLLTITIVTALLFQFGCAEEDRSLDQFAQCLTDKGVKLYGTYWCPNCEEQKKLFKDSFSKIEYIECDPKGENSQSLLCTQKGIDSIPTWEFADGSMMVGLQKLESLSEKTDCPLPESEL